MTASENENDHYDLDHFDHFGELYSPKENICCIYSIINGVPKRHTKVSVVLVLEFDTLISRKITSP